MLILWITGKAPNNVPSVRYLPDPSMAVAGPPDTLFSLSQDGSFSPEQRRKVDSSLFRWIYRCKCWLNGVVWQGVVGLIEGLNHYLDQNFPMTTQKLDEQNALESQLARRVAHLKSKIKNPSAANMIQRILEWEKQTQQPPPEQVC